VKSNFTIDAHRGEGQGEGEGWGRVNIGPHRLISKHFFNKNAIKPKIRGPPPPRQFFLKALTPLGILANLQVPPALYFQPVCIYYFTSKLKIDKFCCFHLVLNCNFFIDIIFLFKRVI
jgi:hypothetical protein